MEMNNDALSVKNTVFVLISSLALACLAAPAVASDVGGLCSGSLGLTTGQWARYATDAPLMKERMKSRYAIVGMEADHYWLEFEAAMPMGNGAMIIKLLIPDWPYPEESVKRALMQMPRIEGMDSMPPMEMPPSGVQKDNFSEPIRLACENMDEGVQESVTVPAGTFTATRIPLRHLGKDIWLSSSVPFGMIKLVDENDMGTILMAFGSDAEPAITEMPQKLPGME